MPYPQFDRSQLRIEPLASRQHKKAIERDHVSPDSPPPRLGDTARQAVADCAARIVAAREGDRAVIVAFGAHAVKNGLGPVFAELLSNGWVTHLATNGAGMIHDWEFAYLGQSCEHVGPMVRQGRFGNWQETGFYINLALVVGAFEGKGYGESIGALIQNDGLTIPSVTELQTLIRRHLSDQPEVSAAAADLLDTVRRFELSPGPLHVPHPYKRYSAQAAAYELGVPFTGHPMIGHDIIYNHPMNHCAALGRAAGRDFLAFAHAVTRIDKGVYISLGSAVMSPMVFEKSLSMAQNLAIQQGSLIENHFMMIVDLARSDWDWSQGEPPEEHPAYYLRYNKTFSRMGGTMRYLSLDNREFLLALLCELRRV